MSKSYVDGFQVSPKAHLKSESNCGSVLLPCGAQPNWPSFSAPFANPGKISALVVAVRAPP